MSKKKYPKIAYSKGPNISQQRFVDRRDNKWNVARLIALSENLPVFDYPIIVMDLESITPRFDSMREAIEWVRRVQQADLSYPVIFDLDGVLMDGRHRIAKAMLDGHDTVKAKRFDYFVTPDIWGQSD